MISSLTLAILALAAVVTPARADITGQYVEARTCDVWTGPCFANADSNLSGKNAVMAWKVEKGTFDGVPLDGLSIVAVISASNTLGLTQDNPASAVLIVDSRATSAQREALVRLVQKQGGALLKNIAAVQSATVSLTVCACKGETCVELNAGTARVKTRCIDSDHDKACGNETAYYPPLSSGVVARPAGVVENVWSGTGLNETWGDFDRRGGYVGSFTIR